MKLYKLPRVLHLYTSPKELREIADKMELLWEKAEWGKDLEPAHVIHGAGGLRIEILPDQEEMYLNERLLGNPKVTK